MIFLHSWAVFYTGQKNNKFFSRIYAKGLIVPIAAVLITFYAFYNAVDYKVTSYEILINKISSVPSLEIVMVSDLHVGTSVTKKQLVRIREMVEELSPDIFFICGDIFDHASYISRALRTTPIRTSRRRGVQGCNKLRRGYLEIPYKDGKLLKNCKGKTQFFKTLNVSAL